MISLFPEFSLTLTYIDTIIIYMLDLDPAPDSDADELKINNEDSYDSEEEDNQV